jgi:hypothetical protein
MVLEVIVVAECRVAVVRSTSERDLVDGYPTSS